MTRLAPPSLSDAMLRKNVRGLLYPMSQLVKKSKGRPDTLTLFESLLLRLRRHDASLPQSSFWLLRLSAPPVRPPQPKEA
ncbi:hypothetical protein LMH87_000173 [Akanthomyces muscarius]|uniref:Uncharacterized protein n=1 Tax=Akanthomyces muscarius TaxID=2231603 RepID=A0A9W8QEI7_AKAMU|nr:hypothetical protein LMH87_000173 [Akanthomyces muscarius]KAJ4154900.1 hypothetical protein LMH87_000173 [Akanthomyces muscarius]